MIEFFIPIVPPTTTAQMHKVALSGRINPPGTSHLSRAYRTVSSMDS